MLALRQVPQPDAAQVAQRNLRRQPLPDLVNDGLRQQYLASVRRAHDSRRTVDRAAEQVAVPLLDDAQMQTAAHLERDPVGDLRIAKRQLQRKRRIYRVQRIGEGGIDAVAGRLHDGSAVARDGRARQHVVPRERPRHPHGFLLPQPGAALYVGKEKGRAVW